MKGFLRRIVLPFALLSLALVGLYLWQQTRPESPPPAREATPLPSPLEAALPLQPPVPEETPALTPAPEKPGHPVATRIRIPRLGIDLPVIEGDGIDIPFGKVGHFPGTAQPGQGSNAFFYGHARRGSFLELWWAKAGDEVIVQMSDGQELHYQITEVLPRVPYNALQYLAPTPEERLTLQTCTSAQPADPRFIVIAHPKNW